MPFSNNNATQVRPTYNSSYVATKEKEKKMKANDKKGKGKIMWFSGHWHTVVVFEGLNTFHVYVYIPVLR